jgi:two-component system, OmpR family, phosphate regulon response regulator PhoB
MPAILIVSAATEVASTLEAPLREAGHELVRASSAGEALMALRDHRPDLVLLDLELPGTTGLALCRDLRSELDTMHLPIVALTSEQGESQRVAALELGADDLVTKPFSVRELVLRVRAVLRRSSSRTHDPLRSPRPVGAIEVDVLAHRAFVDGVEVPLTPVELRLLAMLMAHVGRARSREELLARVWNASPGMKTRTVDTHVKRLRAKLGPAGSLLETVRGIGYRLVAPAPPGARAAQAWSRSSAEPRPPAEQES